MGTSAQTMTFLLDQIGHAGAVRSKKMFGEYCLYWDGKPVAFVCDDQLFLKPTVAGRAFIGSVTEAPAYPGSKMYYLISADRWEDRDWLVQLVRTTADALPANPSNRPRTAPARAARTTNPDPKR